MNVTFSCKVLSRWARLVTVFSRAFKFSRIVIYRAKSRRSGLEWGDLLILFNRNNCSLSVGVFSFSLIWESISAQFLTFVPHGVLNFYNLSEELGSFMQSAYSPFEEQAQVFLACSHFHFIYYISQRSNSKNCFRITGYSVQVRQLDDNFESPGRNELIVWKTDSRFLSLHTPVWGSRA